MSDETKTLAVRDDSPVTLATKRGLVLDSMDAMWQFCVAVANSKEFKDVGSPEAALVRIQAGMELGLSPIWSLANIMVYQGRPSVWGDAMLGLCLANPLCEDVIETATGSYPNDTYTARCEVRRKGREPIVREFSVADSKRAGIFERNVHKPFPKRMLQMRARGFALRDAFADSLRGLGMREELEGVEKVANVREVTRALREPIQFADEPPPAQDLDANGLAKEDLFK